MKEAIQIVDGCIECPHCCGALRAIGSQDGKCSHGHHSVVVAFKCLECSKAVGLNFGGSHDEKKPGTTVQWQEPLAIVPVHEVSDAIH